MKSRAFLKRLSEDWSEPFIEDRTDATFPKTVHCGPFIVTVDRFDRMVTIKYPIKLYVLHRSKHTSWDFKKIELSRHPLSRFSRVLPLPLSFPHPRRGRSRDLVEYRRRNRSLNPPIAFFVFFVIKRLNRRDLIAIGD